MLPFEGDNNTWIVFQIYESTLIPEFREDNNTEQCQNNTKTKKDNTDYSTN